LVRQTLASPGIILGAYDTESRNMSDFDIHVDLRSPEGRAAAARAKEIVSAHVYETWDRGAKDLTSVDLGSVVTDLTQNLASGEQLLVRVSYLVHAQGLVTMALVRMVSEGRIPPGSDAQAIVTLLFEEVDSGLAEPDSG
jgi:hypothetical protein